MPRFKKGSREAKAYMAKLRAMVGKGKKRKSYKRPARSTKARKNPVARRRRVWRRIKKRAKTLTIPIAPTLGLAAGISPTLFGFQGSQGPIRGAIWHFQNTGPAAGLKEFVRIGSMTFTGYDPEGFEPFGKYLGKGLAPILIGFAVHWLASKLGVNRMLGAAKVPILRI